jgi:hypothetical protein
MGFLQNLPVILLRGRVLRSSKLSPYITKGALLDNKGFHSSLPTAYAEGNYKPEKIYPNVDVAKIQILSDNKNQSGIYL